MIKIEQRASTVLFKFIRSNCQDYVFLVPANVCSVVPLTLLKLGVSFKFVDIDRTTHAGSLELIKAELVKLGSRKKGLIYVNSYGNKRNLGYFYDAIKQQDSSLIIIEDNCLCVPETTRTYPYDNIDLELYSTGDSKFVQLSLGGGYGLMKDCVAYSEHHEPFNPYGYRDQVEQVKKCRKDNSRFTYRENGWLPFEPLGSALSPEEYIDRVKSEVLESRTHKVKINHIYDGIIPAGLKLGDEYNNWRYNVIVPTVHMQKAILDELSAEGLFASAHYASAAFIFNGQQCANAEYEHDHMINLFNEYKYSEEMAVRTAMIIKRIWEQS